MVYFATLRGIPQFFYGSEVLLKSPKIRDDGATRADMLGGWAGDYPDPENFLQLFVSTNAAPGTNSSNFKDKDFDALYEKVRTQLPSPQRANAVRQMTAILNHEKGERLKRVAAVALKTVVELYRLTMIL